MPDQGFAEISIEGHLMVEGTFPGGEYPTVRIADVLRQIDAARGRGVRTLLLKVWCAGGEALGAFALYDSLRSFSEAGGVVIAHVRGAVSSAAVLILGADYIVAEPTAEFCIHGAGAFNRGTGVRESDEFLDEQVKRLSIFALAAAVTHTLLPVAIAAKWTSHPFDLEGDDPQIIHFGAADAVELVGCADSIGSEDEARRLCQQLSAGGALPLSPRRAKLESRGAVAEEFKRHLCQARRVGGLLAVALRRYPEAA